MAKKTGILANPFEWYDKQTATVKIMALCSVIIILGSITLWILPTLPSGSGGSSLNVDLSYEFDVPSLLIKLGETEDTENYETVDIFLCDYLYKYNETNVSIGNYAWAKVQEGKYNCVRYEIV